MKWYCDFIALDNEYLISIRGQAHVPFHISIFPYIFSAQGTEKFGVEFRGNEQNSSRIYVSEQNFEQNKRFLRALPAGRISYFTSRIYPSLFVHQKNMKL